MNIFAILATLLTVLAYVWYCKRVGDDFIQHDERTITNVLFSYWVMPTLILVLTLFIMGILLVGVGIVYMFWMGLVT